MAYQLGSQDNISVIVVSFASAVGASSDSLSGFL
jgi:hypothetical protein